MIAHSVDGTHSSLAGAVRIRTVMKKSQAWKIQGPFPHLEQVHYPDFLFLRLTSDRRHKLSPTCFPKIAGSPFIDLFAGTCAIHGVGGNTRAAIFVSTTHGQLTFADRSLEVPLKRAINIKRSPALNFFSRLLT